MSRDSALVGGAPTLKPAIWLWPAAAALLAAWPVWRSLFPDTPDVGEGWWRLQPLLGLANALLYIAWAAKWQRKVHDLWFTSFAIAVAAVLLIGSMRRGDAALADLNALMIGWIAAPAIFATLVLLQTQAAGVEAGCKAPRQIGMLPPIPRLGAVILAVAAGIFVSMFFIAPWPSFAVIMGVVSPGLILAWAALSDTARSVLSKRQVYFADAGDLLWLTRRRRWSLRAPTILLTDRIKLVSLYPGADIKPGELIGLAAATTMEEETDIARAIQEFGVSHRIKVPALRQVQDGEPTPSRRAILASGAIVELCAADDSLDLSAHAEAIELARSQHRTVVAMVERTPNPRVLGVIVFAIGARAGAAETLRLLRERDVEVALSAPPRHAADELALKSLSVAQAPANPSAHQETTSVWRGAQAAANAGEGLAIGFGGARPKSTPTAMHIIVAREDARSLLDLARFADDFRARTKMVTAMASVPGWVLIAAGFGYVPSSPFLVTGVAVIGIAIAAVTPQVLRLSPALDKEGAEE